MQEISLTNKSIHWFTENMVVKNRDMRITSDFNPLVNCKVPSKTSKLLGIVHTFGKKYDKNYIFFNCKHPDVDILEYYNSVINMQSTINNYCQLDLE